jgi:processive 1,2-diacylglycerol beta-glucosyltransferase
MAEYKRMFPDAPPVVAIVTDFGIHGFWIHENVDRYVVATEAMRVALLARRIRPEAILVGGIPVRAEFASRPRSRAQLWERLNLPRDRHVVLLMGGGLGIAPIERMLAALKSVRMPLAAVVIAGKNARMRRRLTDIVESVEYPVRALPFVENVYEYMHAADVLVTKPGGLTTAEALVAQIPMVLCKPLPGQEERNARFLLEAGAALRIRQIDDLPPVVERLLAGDDERDRMIAAARRVGRPNAAGEAAAMIGDLVRLGKEDVA